MEEIIRIDNLFFCYPDGQQALTNINLTIYNGGLVGYAYGQEVDDGHLLGYVEELFDPVLVEGAYPAGAVS